ncbi:3'(2'),5'-bisphosphate nucleotidase CysQ [Catellatospora sp. IY07-71]|uniref:3'(2'),5'-bisphosphate nucleotidase CysQ n=1 Tax=Catellatospora sp. IY07-71 TaxID=2728827 RepID=UPI001BB30F96|nr:3'(2'),5'-bisphosphate nucleotidase CysQ [Catellatospora sp. IY07-71]BCJ72268.1 3'(2'),5'-bisphosphate nucleotidase CysQ [Catellatospora sp. IY07-71]
MPPVEDGAFAVWLARQAGDLLLTLRDEIGFDDPAGLRHAGDKRSHDLIMTELARWRPADAVLSEEGVDDPARLTANRLWIIDPLDGTREFGEQGRADWAVHVALWRRTGEHDGELVAGAVGLPAQQRVLGSEPAPAYPPLSPEAAAGGAIRIATSRTRPPAFLAAVAEQVGAELVPMGSAGAKIAAVVTGEVDAYIHAGGQYEWDSAAPVAVAAAAGLHTSRVDGARLRYNQANASLPDLLVCRRDLAADLLSALSQHR